MNDQNSFLEACGRGDIEKVKFLLEKGADIKERKRMVKPCKK